MEIEIKEREREGERDGSIFHVLINFPSEHNLGLRHQLLCGRMRREPTGILVYLKLQLNPLYYTACYLCRMW